MAEAEFKASVEISRKWDGSEVAIEIVDKIKKKISSPNFILLFTTIHYEKEFQKMLNGIKDAFPDSPLIGGTVAGFMTQEGCYTRGVTALAVEYPNMDVAVGIGHNTKKNPEKAVAECFSNFKQIEDDQQFFIEIVSGAVIPKFPKIGRQNVIKSKTAGETSIKLLPLISRLNMGADRADEVLNSIVSRSPASKLVGITCMDDRKFAHNYQFFNNEILENALCLLKIKSDLKFELNTSFGLIKKPVDSVEITLNPDLRVVKEINGKTAVEALYDIVGIDQENLRMVDRFYSQSFYYPFGYSKDNFLHPCILAGVLGEKVYFASQVKKTKLDLYQLTGNQIIKSTEELIKSFDDGILLNLQIMCETYIETLGDYIYKIYDMIKAKNRNLFLVLFASGESINYGETI